MILNFDCPVLTSFYVGKGHKESSPMYVFWNSICLITLVSLEHLFPPNLFNVLDISGNTDVVIPVTSTRYSINALKLPTVSPWRAWYDEGEVSDSTMNDSCISYDLVSRSLFSVITTLVHCYVI